MHRLEPSQNFLEFRRKPVIGFDLRREESVATRFGLVEDEEERGAGGLAFVRDVRVPAGMVDTVTTEIVLEEIVLGVPVDDVEFGVAFDVA